MIARFGMLECGTNFKGTLSNICSTCSVTDDENHRLNHCTKYSSNNFYNSVNKSNFQRIFTSNMDELRVIVRDISQVWNVQKSNGSMNDLWLKLVLPTCLSIYIYCWTLPALLVLKSTPLHSVYIIFKQMYQVLKSIRLSIYIDLRSKTHRLCVCDAYLSNISSQINSNQMGEGGNYNPTV